ncbi:MAG: hypothetical protein U0Y96_02365 [Candidatus Kapaibacterium sp.]|nr:hypothetical protein [Bacteroidota bacterium]
MNYLLCLFIVFNCCLYSTVISGTNNTLSKVLTISTEQLASNNNSDIDAINDLIHHHLSGEPKSSTHKLFEILRTDSSVREVLHTIQTMNRNSNKKGYVAFINEGTGYSLVYNIDDVLSNTPPVQQLVKGEVLYCLYLHNSLLDSASARKKPYMVKYKNIEQKQSNELAVTSMYSLLSPQHLLSKLPKIFGLGLAGSDSVDTKNIIHITCYIEDIGSYIGNNYPYQLLVTNRVKLANTDALLYQDYEKTVELPTLLKINNVEPKELDLCIGVSFRNITIRDALLVSDTTIQSTTSEKIPLSLLIAYSPFGKIPDNSPYTNIPWYYFVKEVSIMGGVELSTNPFQQFFVAVGFPLTKSIDLIGGYTFFSEFATTEVSLSTTKVSNTKDIIPKVMSSELFFGISYRIFNSLTEVQK